jgi:hypothetical protein
MEHRKPKGRRRENTDKTGSRVLRCDFNRQKMKVMDPDWVGRKQDGLYTEYIIKKGSVRHNG